MFPTLKKVCLLIVVVAVFLPIPAWIAIDAYRMGTENRNKEVSAKIWLPENSDVHSSSENIDVADWLTKENGKQFSGAIVGISLYEYQEDKVASTNRHLVIFFHATETVSYRTIVDGHAYMAETLIKTPPFVTIKKAEYAGDGVVKFTTGEIAYFPIVGATVILGLGINIILGFALWIVSTLTLDLCRIVACAVR